MRNNQRGNGSVFLSRLGVNFQSLVLDRNQMDNTKFEAEK